MERQEWERQNALQEKQKRRAIHDSQETQDTPENQNAGAAIFNLESSENTPRRVRGVKRSEIYSKIQKHSLPGQPSSQN